jgi:ELWxxDGT repeat protein
MSRLAALTVGALAIGVLAPSAVGGLTAAPQTPYLVADIDPAAGAGSSPQMVGSVDDRLFFSARRPDVGQELWVTSGTAASTKLLEMTPGTASSGAARGLPFGSSLLFTGVTDDTPSLWISDGSPQGTRRLAPYALTSFGFGVLGASALFGSGPGVNFGDLWISDGTAAGTVLLKAIPPAGYTVPREFEPMADRMLFTIGRDPETSVPSLWRTDGTADGTVRILNRPCQKPRRVGAKAFMLCSTGLGGLALWTTDGTAGGTRLVRNLDPPQGSNLDNLTDVDGTVFFSAATAPGEHLWKSDGTFAGTVPVQDGLAGAYAASPSHLTPSNGVLFFAAYTPSAGFELWRSDGTSAGTYMVRDIAPGPDHGVGGPTDGLTAVPGGVVFPATTPESGTELWFSDGTSAGTRALGDIEPGPDTSRPHSARLVGSRLYFLAQQASLGMEPWAVDFPSAVSVADAAVEEGDASTVSASFAITLTAPASAPVAVAYTTAPGTAESGLDFLPTAGSLTFAPGSVGPVSVEVPVQGDLQDEPDETFHLVLSSVVGAPALRSRADAVVLDDDGPTVAIAGVSVTEGDAGSTPAVVTATLTTKDGGPAAGATTLTFATSSGTASSGPDFENVAGALTFAPGAASGTVASVSIPVRGDSLDEPDETFTVTFETTGDELLTNPVAVVRILDDDGVDAAAPTEITPGTMLRADLAPPAGRATDRDYYVMLQQPHTSYEVVVDEAAGEATPLTLQRVELHGSVVQTAAATGIGSSLSLRWAHTVSYAETAAQHLVVSSAPCASACGADDRYRLRVYETTLRGPRFNNLDGQGTVVLLQNLSSETISGQLLFWLAAGWLGDIEPFTVPARGAIAINTLPLARSSGSLTITHDGSYGALVGKAVALDPATGLSFDTPFTQKAR